MEIVLLGTRGRLGVVLGLLDVLITERTDGLGTVSRPQSASTAVGGLPLGGRQLAGRHLQGAPLPAASL